MPKVVVCTPTCNRRWAYSFSRACLESQIEQDFVWVIVDNSDVPDADWSAARDNPRVVYEKVDGKHPIGWLRNKCIELALEHEFDYLVFWDDDDYYPPTRISAGIAALESKPEAEISCATAMFMLLTRENVMMRVGPFHDNHGTAATYTIRRRYVEKNRFNPEMKRGEEAPFTHMWKTPMAQVAPEQCIVVMGHGKNTVDKSDVLKRPNVYRATIVNSDNGRMYFRSHWPVRWDTFRATFSV
jgi:glycosyltransferase involved in cell wall biosynthesis